MKTDSDVDRLEELLRMLLVSLVPIAVGMVLAYYSPAPMPSGVIVLMLLAAGFLISLWTIVTAIMLVRSDGGGSKLLCLMDKSMRKVAQRINPRPSSKHS